MSVAFIVITLVLNGQSESFQFGREFKTLTDCKNYIYGVATKNVAMGCLAIAKLPEGQKWEDNSFNYKKSS